MPSIAAMIAYQTQPMMVSMSRRCLFALDILIFFSSLLYFKGFWRTLHSPIDSWSFHLEFIWQGVQPKFCLFPPGFHLDSTPFHITLQSIFHLSMDSTWTPAVLIIYFVGIGLLMKTRSHDGPKNK